MLPVTTVLIVEDDKGVRRMLRFAMREAGFDVVEAETGLDALSLLNTANVDAVVLDLGLPDQAGGLVLNKLRAPTKARQKEIAWLAVSAVDAREAEMTFGKFDGRFIPKPYDPWQLIGRIKSMLAQSNDGTR